MSTNKKAFNEYRILDQVHRNCLFTLFSNASQREMVIYIVNYKKTEAEMKRDSFIAYINGIGKHLAFATLNEVFAHKRSTRVKMSIF